jgi:hypothetical protein
MVEVTHEFSAPRINMVQVIRNIVDSYKMGPFRALAQEPPQNSIDAKADGAQGPVKIEYRLHRHESRTGNMYVLTITDGNTTGLRGPALSPADLDRREQETGSLELTDKENWAAWEAMGYTKTGEDFLGARGQGKTAALFHSRHELETQGADSRSLERMVMLYDTRLPNGTYRLGVRWARPADGVLNPPYEGEKAKEIVRGEFTGEGLPAWQEPPIPLYLDPLTEVGSRIIIPFLTDEALEAFHSGEIERWLQRCWWRAIQVGDVEIKVINEVGDAVVIRVPQWWRDEPWDLRPRPCNLLVRENIPLEQGSPLRIKRIVLLYDEELTNDEIEGYPLAQFAGVQYLRRHQWIETWGVERFTDIPHDKQNGFRGFVEFDRQLERELRGVESSQHDYFERTRKFVRQIDAHVKDAVHNFAEQQGWLKGETKPLEQDKTAEEMLRKITDIFLSEQFPGKGDRPVPVVWDVELDIELPRGNSVRVDWGETIKNIVARCTHDPQLPRRDVKIKLTMVAPDGTRTELESKDRTTAGGGASATFTDLTVTRVAHRRGEVTCSEPGRYRLEALFESQGQRVGSASRNIYIRSDPPPKKTNSFTVGIAVTNASSGSTRINDGDMINVAVTVSNRTTSEATLLVDASLEALLLADSVRINLRGRPEGDAPFSKLLSYTGIRVLTKEPQDNPKGRFVILPPGRHAVRADVRDEEGNIVASASKSIFVEMEPKEGGGGKPFVVKAREEAYYPTWELTPPLGNEPLWTLWYAPDSLSYKEAALVGKRPPNGVVLSGIDLFWAETYSSALVEWALIVYRDHGDEGGFKLLATRTNKTDDRLWERYYSAIDELIQSYEDPLRCLDLKRRVVTLMLHIVEGGLN